MAGNSKRIEVFKHNKNHFIAHVPADATEVTIGFVEYNDSQQEENNISKISVRFDALPREFDSGRCTTRGSVTSSAQKSGHGLSATTGFGSSSAQKSGHGLSATTGFGKGLGELKNPPVFGKVTASSGTKSTAGTQQKPTTNPPAF